MKLQIYAVRDVQADNYGRPLFVHNAAVVTRQFTDLVNDRETEFSRHPEDYQLFHLGEYNDADGSIVPLKVPVLICNASSLLKNTPPQLVQKA